jgi:transcriptional antiterminator Rof (Rho-off)
MSPTKYTPIACSVYDLLEATVVKNAVIRIETASHDEIRSQDVRVVDLFSKDRAEYMKAVDISSNQEFTLRLDEILLITDPATKKIYSPISCSTPRQEKEQQ